MLDSSLNLSNTMQRVPGGVSLLFSTSFLFVSFRTSHCFLNAVSLPDLTPCKVLYLFWVVLTG